ncbi:MAG: hypothetical protein LC112_13930 [Flavobacteriales bacterium]|nr:hypothetical protein [Flavobacteriales bacterium]
MKRYFEKGDRVKVKPAQEVNELLKEFFANDDGRTKIVNDIADTDGEVYAVSPNEGHIQVLYRKDGVTHSWKVPVSVFH